MSELSRCGDDRRGDCGEVGGIHPVLTFMRLRGFRLCRSRLDGSGHAKARRNAVSQVNLSARCWVPGGTAPAGGSCGRRAVSKKVGSVANSPSLIRNSWERFLGSAETPSAPLRGGGTRAASLLGKQYQFVSLGARDAVPAAWPNDGSLAAHRPIRWRSGPARNGAVGDGSMPLEGSMGPVRRT